MVSTNSENSQPLIGLARRRAFELYLRTGRKPDAPRLAERKYTGSAQAAAAADRGTSTSHYVWRTMLDDRVRRRHLEREGHVFARAEPPSGGPPGTEPNCRCWAEPYYGDPAVPDALQPLAHAYHTDPTGSAPWASIETLRGPMAASRRASCSRGTARKSAPPSAEHWSRGRSRCQRAMSCGSIPAAACCRSPSAMTPGFCCSQPGRRAVRGLSAPGSTWPFWVMSRPSLIPRSGLVLGRRRVGLTSLRCCPIWGPLSPWRWSRSTRCCGRRLQARDWARRIDRSWYPRHGPGRATTGSCQLWSTHCRRTAFGRPANTCLMFSNGPIPPHCG